jgi:ATP-dependent exoDNAse (exonuclease V) alpha subunit
MTQKEALNILKLGHNVFLTGAAGSGKTYLLNQYIDYLKSNDVGVGVTASTGIAATHMNGRTIHSWAHIGIKDELKSTDLSYIYNRLDYRMQLLEDKVLIIDEVSMLHHFRLDMVNQVLQKIHQNVLPFGGIQVILCGDLFQLPPVTRNGGQSKYVTDSRAWDSMNIRVCYLTEQHRQKDIDYLQLLNEMRVNNVSNNALMKLHARLNVDIDSPITPTKLFTHNADVDAINNFELAKLKTEDHAYEVTSKGEDRIVNTLKENCLAPSELHLKEGAVVMFVQNNFPKGYVNGTLGTVVGFDKEDHFPLVKVLSGKSIKALPGSWRVEEGRQVIAEINQVPLRLAWAITVHKSQGMTLDIAQVDLSKAFVEGMGYVALSRVKTLKGIKLLGINDKALKVDPRIIAIDKRLQERSDQAASELAKIKRKELKKLQKEYIKRMTATYETASLID